MKHKPHDYDHGETDHAEHIGQLPESQEAKNRGEHYPRVVVHCDLTRLREPISPGYPELAYCGTRTGGKKHTHLQQ